MNRQPPDFDGAERAYLERAIEADRYYVRPWLGYADLAYRLGVAGRSRERSALEEDPDLLENAGQPRPATRLAWSLHIRRAEVIRQLLRRVGSELKPIDDIRYRGEIVKETRIATLLYPSNALLHARLAEASAEISMFGDAVKEAEEAAAARRPHPAPRQEAPRLRTANDSRRCCRDGREREQAGPRSARPTSVTDPAPTSRRSGPELASVQLADQATPDRDRQQAAGRREQARSAAASPTAAGGHARFGRRTRGPRRRRREHGQARRGSADAAPFTPATQQKSVALLIA